MLHVSPRQKCKEKCLTERYFVSSEMSRSRAPAETCTCRFLLFGNMFYEVHVDVADHNIIRPHSYRWIALFTKHVNIRYCARSMSNDGVAWLRLVVCQFDRVDGVHKEWAIAVVLSVVLIHEILSCTVFLLMTNSGS